MSEVQKGCEPVRQGERPCMQGRRCEPCVVRTCRFLAEDNKVSYWRVDPLLITGTMVYKHNHGTAKYRLDSKCPTSPNSLMDREDLKPEYAKRSP